MNYRTMNHRDNLFSILPLFDNYVKRYDDEKKGNLMPLDIIEREDKYLIMANIPGVLKKNLKISFKDNQLNIEAKNDVKEEKNSKVLVSERFSGNYHRSIYLHEDCDIDNIKAKLENGVLTITIPKIEKKINEIKID